MSEYYTPEIEEFHYGFEFEIVPSIGMKIIDFGAPTQENETVWATEFVPMKFGINKGDPNFFGTMYPEILGAIEKKKVRVKHLDREDIESLGWVYHKPWIRESEGLIFISNMYGLTWFKKTNTFSIWERMQSDCEGETYFQGIIKNKSELVKLLKQLGY